MGPFMRPFVGPFVGRFTGRRRDRADAGCGARPDDQDRAGGVVDDEPGGLAQALGPQPGPVAVARHDEQGGVRRGGHHFPFGETAALNPLAWPAEAVGGGGEQFARGGPGEFRDARARVARGPATAEQSEVGGVRGLRELGRGDVKQ